MLMLIIMRPCVYESVVDLLVEERNLNQHSSYRTVDKALRGDVSCFRMRARADEYPDKAQHVCGHYHPRAKVGDRGKGSLSRGHYLGIVVCFPTLWADARRI